MMTALCPMKSGAAWGGCMPPDRSNSDAEQTASEVEQTRADHDQTRADREQTGSDRDQSSADRDQIAADRDQLAADADQAARDRDLEAGSPQGDHDDSDLTRTRTTATRLDTSRERLGTSRARHDTAVDRDASARARDLAAEARDAAAAKRDREAAERDAELSRLLAVSESQPAPSIEEIILRATRDRAHAQADRERAAAHRAQAARDRRQAARDRESAARDRAEAALERQASATDSLTGAWSRGPGLRELDHEISRARRGNGRLVVAYVDVNGLKAINDARGHAAGDALLARVVAALRSNLRPYELIVRVGGDEFICALSDAVIDDVRGRFDEIADQLRGDQSGAAITVGFAELTEADSATDLINRADGDFLSAHRSRGRGTSADASGPPPATSA
jgi:diguanylate cyclase (GGDEF)-like protein